MIFCLLSQANLSVEALPPEIVAGEGEIITLRIVITQPGDVPLPYLRPFLNPPEGIDPLGASARSGSAPAESKSSLQYSVNLKAARVGDYQLKDIGVEYLDPESGEKQAIAANPVSVRVVNSGILGIPPGWAVFFLALLGAVLALSVWFAKRKRAGTTPDASRVPDREQAWQALEDIRRFRIRGEEAPMLEKILELEGMLNDPDRDEMRDVKEKVETVKYGGNRLSPAELDGLYRRIELKVKSEFPPEEGE